MIVTSLAPTTNYTTEVIDGSKLVHVDRKLVSLRILLHSGILSYIECLLNNKLIEPGLVNPGRLSLCM